MSSQMDRLFSKINGGNLDPAPVDPVQPAKKKEEVKKAEVEVPVKKRRGPAPMEIPHVGVRFCITPRQREALRIKAFKDPSLDKSGHVRAALETYLAEELKEVPEDFRG